LTLAAEIAREYGEREEEEGEELRAS